MDRMNTASKKYSKIRTLLDESIEKLKDPKLIDNAKEWLNNHYKRVNTLFADKSLVDFVFAPFKKVFTPPANTDTAIYSIITTVAVVNAVLAALPGKMGVGVLVSWGLEGWMAFNIARHVGFKLNKISDVWQYFGVVATVIVTIVWGFKALLGVTFSLFSLVSGPLNPLIFAELFVTNLYGVIFWFGFLNLSQNKAFNSFRITKLWSITQGLTSHQYNLIKHLVSRRNLKTVGSRFNAYLTGNFPVNQKFINGEVFSTAAMAYLMSGQYEKLEGPLGDTFIDAIRLRWSAQLGQDASIEEIASLFREYTPSQIDGALNTIKGKMFEIMVTEQENIDGDQWHATMHTDETFPGSDIIFSNAETGQQMEISLKAASDGNSYIIEEALSRYPNTPIMTTDELASLFKDDSRVFGSGFLNEDLENISKEKYRQLIEEIEPINEYQVVIGGVTMGSTAALWPFVMAYLRKKIDKERLEIVFKHVLGEAGVKLVSYMVFAFLFGPLFAWYLLARGVKGLVGMVEPTEKILLEFKPKKSRC